MALDARAVRDRTVIRPRKGWALPNLRELYGARDLLLALALRDFRSRYRQTVGGFVWFIIYPLISTGVFVLIFTRLAELSTEGYPALLYTYVGMLGWLVFFITAQTGTQSILTNRSLVAKVWFPRLVLPLAASISAFLMLAVNFVVLVAMFAAYRLMPPLAALTLPLWLLGFAALALGPTMLIAGGAVKFRDLALVTPFVLQLLQFLSPLAYGRSSLPTDGLLETVYVLNPLSTLIEGMRWALLGGSGPTARQLLYTVGVIVVLGLAGSAVFTRSERSFADVI